MSIFCDLSIDVQNIGRWGINFQDLHGTNMGWYQYPFQNSARIEGALGYIGWIQSDPSQDDGDTPIFWDTWHDYALTAEYDDPTYETMPDFRLNWHYGWDRHYLPLADWERDLLGWNEHIAWRTVRDGNYSDSIWELINANRGD